MSTKTGSQECGSAVSSQHNGLDLMCGLRNPTGHLNGCASSQFAVSTIITSLLHKEKIPFVPLTNVLDNRYRNSRGLNYTALLQCILSTLF